MAESTDLGTAIGLGTRMTPDREKPLTTGANTFIKLEMGKVAAAAKAAAAKQKALDAIGSSLKLTGEPVNKHLQREMSHATNQGYFNILNSKSQIDANNNWTSADSVIKSVKQESNREDDIVNGRQKGLLISDLAVQGLNNGDDKEIEKAKSDEGLYGTYTTVPTKGVSSKEDKYTIINHNPVYANINLDSDLEKDVKSYIDSKPLTSTGKTVFGHGEGSRTLSDSDLEIIAARNAQNEQNATTIIDANIGKAREKWAEKQKFYAEKGIDINVDKKAGHQAKTEIAQDLFMDNLRGIAKTKFDYLTPPQGNGDITPINFNQDNQQPTNFVIKRTINVPKAEGGLYKHTVEAKIQTGQTFGFKPVKVISHRSDNFIDASTGKALLKGLAVQDVEVGNAVAMPVATQRYDAGNGNIIEAGEILDGASLEELSKKGLVKYKAMFPANYKIKNRDASGFIPAEELSRDVLISQSKDDVKGTQQSIKMAVEDANKFNSKLKQSAPAQQTPKKSNKNSAPRPQK